MFHVLIPSVSVHWLQRVKEWREVVVLCGFSSQSPPVKHSPSIERAKLQFLSFGPVTSSIPSRAAPNKVHHWLLFGRDFYVSNFLERPKTLQMWEENGWTFVLVMYYQDKEQNHVKHRNKSPFGFHVLSYSSSAVIN